jgi:hypothetical protein
MLKVLTHMHFITFVITEEKPTQEILHAKLDKFIRVPGRLDWFTLGGRYTGQIESNNGFRERD